MQKITDIIKTGRILVSDGALGTFLQAKGLQPGECPELWNIEKPSEVMDVYQQYVDAGADMVQTNSFGGTSFKLKNYGLSHRVAELNRAAAAISRKAAGENRNVIASVGPTGQILMMGEVSETEMYNAFKEQIVALAEGGADTICIETMSDLDEALLAVKAAKEHTHCEVICTMTFEKTVANEYRSMMGISPSEMTLALTGAGVDILGANCGNGAENMIQIVQEIRSINKSIPVLVHANAGLPKYIDGKTVFPETPDETAKFVSRLIEAGANIIGGCCGTTPEHILKISEIVANYNFTLLSAKRVKSN